MPGDSLVIATKVKEYIRSKDLNCASEVPDALSEKVRELLDAAIQRATENGRKTVKPYDL